MTVMTSYSRPVGQVSMHVLRNIPLVEPIRRIGLKEVVKFAGPRKGLADEVNSWRLSNLPNLWRGLHRVMTARALNLATFYGVVHLVRMRPEFGPELMEEFKTYSGPFTWFGWLSSKNIKMAIDDFGLASMRVVTNNGVAHIVNAFQNTVEVEIMKYHALGTGGTAEAAGDSALVTELTTQYNPDSTRATGSLTNNGANIFRTVGTNTVDASAAVTEHGVLSQAATGGGVLLDRSLFSVINLVSADSLQSTYDATFSAGG